MNKTKVTQLFADAKATLSKHSPEILTGIGVAGMITATVLAVKATPKAMWLIEEEKDRLETDKLTALETVKTAWKPYIPAVVTGAASIACIVGASSVNARRNAALATAYQVSRTALSEYKTKVVETIGEKKEKVIRDKVAQDKVEKLPVNNTEIFVTEKGETLFLDPLSQRYFKSDIEKVRKITNDLNYRMMNEMYISLNEFYNELGLPGTKMGDDLGWNINTSGLIEIEFSSQITDDGQPCIVLEYMVEPRYDFSKLM